MHVSPHATEPLTVQSGQGDYAVAFRRTVAEAAEIIPRGNLFLAVDRHVYDLYPAIATMFDSTRTYTFPATEEEKTLSGVERLCRFLQQRDASKRSRLLVVGGGISQDIGTFAAHVYYRGIPFFFFPTTLLAMADSCIGAKCGLNLGAFKNQLGFFQSPAQVVIATQFLETLSHEDVRSGFGEIVKLAIISGERDYDALEREFVEQPFSLSGIERSIVRSLEAKRRVIEQDEYERDLRKTLNYGHTFGHALESLTHHEVPHGLAVAWGVDVANFVSMQLGVMEAATFERFHLLLSANFRHCVRTQYDAPSLIAAMKRDKKAAGDTISLILAQRAGALNIVPQQLDHRLEGYVDEYMRECDIFTHDWI